MHIPLKRRAYRSKDAHTAQKKTRIPLKSAYRSKEDAHTARLYGNIKKNSLGLTPQTPLVQRPEQAYAFIRDSEHIATKRQS